VVGVGGQGALLASNILADVGVKAGYDVKKAEVHGMSQRGGSVNSHVRWGADVKSPVIGRGQVDILVSLEKLETLRYLQMLDRGGNVFIGEFKIPPLTVSSGQDQYPTDSLILEAVSKVTEKSYFVPTLSLAESAGSTRAHNVVLLGAVSSVIEDVPKQIWLEVVDDCVPEKYVEMNREAFQLGRDFVG
jgi:indolepyruvate ferredoxin oxidoreductase beta subunit